MKGMYSDPPSVSILIPVYNARKYLNRCLDSVREQGCTDFEVILCDDGSTDDSAVICEEYCQIDPRFRLLRQKNMGQYMARRNLIRAAAGKYILFLDADDWIEPILLSTVLTFASERESDLVLFGFRSVSDDGNRVLDTSASLYPDGTLFEGENRAQVIRRFLTSVSLNHLWDKLILRSLLEEDSLPPVQYQMTGEDKLQLIPVFQRAKRIGYLARPLYNYRLSSSGTGRNYKLHYMEDICMVEGKVLAMLEEQEMSDQQEIMEDFYHSVALKIAVFAVGVVHNLSLNAKDIMAAFRRYENEPLIRETLKRVPAIRGKMIYRMTYAIYRHRRYTELFILLRLEKYIVRMIKRNKI